MFDSVSILFSDIVTFTEICSRITPMEVVSMLNAMYSIFDTLTERNSVYKVETIGDAYMVVAGAPDKDANHAERVCDMALDMVDAITDLKDPSTGQHLRIRKTAYPLNRFHILSPYSTHPSYNRSRCGRSLGRRRGRYCGLKDATLLSVWR